MVQMPEGMVEGRGWSAPQQSLSEGEVSFPIHFDSQKGNWFYSCNW